MNSTFKNWLNSLTLFATFILSVYTRLVHGGHHQHHVHQGCGQDELVQCAKPLQVLTDNTEFSFVASKEELNRLCPDLQEGLRCIHSYTRRCMNLQQRNHFHKLYEGTSRVIKDLCDDGGEYQAANCESAPLDPAPDAGSSKAKNVIDPAGLLDPALQSLVKFLKHAPCMRGVVAEYEICTKRYQDTMEDISNPRQQYNGSEEAQEADTVKRVCCSFQQYMQCSEHTMRRACGDETAAFTKAFLDRMSSNLIKLHCSEFAEDLRKCGLTSSASSFSRLMTTMKIGVGVALTVAARGVLFR